MKICKNLDLH